MTVFAVQRFLEDHFQRRGLADIDQYAVRLANVFEGLGPSVSEDALARKFGRVRTAFFRRNQIVSRKEFEAFLAAALRNRFQKKKTEPQFKGFEHGLAPVRARFRARRRSVAILLSEFKKTVEARAVDLFWRSRKMHVLRSRPEKIAQGLLAVFARGVVGSDGLVLREMASGIGFVDVGVSFGGVLHLIEIKILKGQLTGASQLATYMRTEGRSTGWLVLIDVRRRRRDAVPARIVYPVGFVRSVVVDLNPSVPSAAL